MLLQELFDELLIERKVEVELSKEDAERLRIKLSKKWKVYKDRMDACGFLSEDLQLCSVCRRQPTTPGLPYTFLLAPKAIIGTNYEIVTTSEPAP